MGILTFLHSIENNQQNDSEFKMGENICELISNNGLLCKVCKEPMQLSRKNMKYKQIKTDIFK